MSRNSIVDMVGLRFGRWLVLEFASIGKHGNAWWRCRCDCGAIKNVNGSHIRQGQSKSCGCLAIENRRLPMGEAAFNRVYNDYIQSAKKRKLVFSLSKEQLKEIIQEDCFYCGAEPSQTKRNENLYGTYTYNGIDRVDNDRGYEWDNVVPCCGDCNWMKRDMSIAKFVGHIEKMRCHMKGTA